MNHILDTNVLMVANGDKSEQASLECIRNCARLLLSIREGINGAVVMDTDKTFLIKREYLKNIDPKKDLAGSRFLLELLKNPNLRIEISITPQNGSFAEFPDDPRLANFDPSDRKWIALARAYNHKHPNDNHSPHIAQASDTKWHNFEAIFKEYGILIDWICE